MDLVDPLATSSTPSAEPVRQEHRPLAERGSPRASPHRGAVLEDVQLGRNLVAPERQIEANAVFRDDTGVGVGVKRKVGGVCGLTRKSFDRSSISFGSGFSPRRFRTDPP